MKAKPKKLDFCENTIKIQRTENLRLLCISEGLRPILNCDLEALEAPPLNSSTASFLQNIKQENEQNNPEISPESFPVQKPPSTFSLPQVSEELAPESTTPNTDLPSCGSPKQKNSSRRNAWGNLSYADLITQAIQSAPEQRLTLSQIYEWVVKNVPYFKDKGDSASSSGWKVFYHLYSQCLEII